MPRRRHSLRMTRQSGSTSVREMSETRKRVGSILFAPPMEEISRRPSSAHHRAIASFWATVSMASTT